MTDAVSNTVHLRPRRALTPAQELIWTSQRLEPSSPHQNMALITRFGSHIDPVRFMAAVDEVVAQSDALRTTIREVDGIPHPTVAAAPPAPCKLIRVEADRLEEWMQERIAVPFDLSRVAYDMVLIDLGEGKRRELGKPVQRRCRSVPRHRDRPAELQRGMERAERR